MGKKYLFLPKSIRTQWLQVGLGILCAVFIFLSGMINLPIFSPFITQIDNLIYDKMVQLNWRHHQKIPRVVIIDIDNDSVKKEGRWPWPRSKMADLINQLKKNGVVTVGMDIIMSEPEVNYALGLKDELQHLMLKLAPEQKQLPLLLDEIAPQVDNDQLFANTLREYNVVLGFLFHSDKQTREGVLPSPLTDPENNFLYRNNFSLYQFSGYNGCLDLFFKASTKAGAVTNLPDLDGTIRHGLMLASYHNKLYPTLALAVAMNYMLTDHVILKVDHHQLYGIQLGGVFVPTNARGQILIPFWGQPGTLNYYSATDIIQGKVNSSLLEGSIALIGSSMILLGDRHHSPVAQSFPGVEVVGNMIQGIVGKQLVSSYDWQTAKGLLFRLLLGVFSAYFFSFWGVIGIFLVTTISIFGILAVSVFLFVFENVYVPMGLILILVMLQGLMNYSYLFFMEKQQKRKIKLLFGQYVPETYVKELLESPEQCSMEGEVRYMTVLFSDIRNFTGISEALDASHVKRLLNTFFTPITEIIFSFRGTIDKYVGDMIIAFWGAPIHDETHAYHAIMSALTIEKQLPEINQKMLENDLPAVDIGIGLATGLMNVGDMGSKFRRAYTVLGDTVNLASRLQDLTKFYHSTVLVSDKTYEKQDRFVWRTVDKIIVKGRKTGLNIYQPLGLVGEVSDEVLIELEEYHQALNDYYMQNWASAEKRFTLLQKRFPDTHLYHIYLGRIKEFIDNPPSNDWNGIFVHHHKKA